MIDQLSPDERQTCLQALKNKRVELVLRLDLINARIRWMYEGAKLFGHEIEEAAPSNEETAP